MDHVTLRDGTSIAIRPIEPADKHALEQGLEAMSERSRYLRFFAPIHHFSEGQLRYLTEIDHRDHEALVAFADDGKPIGVARYVRVEEEPDAAEAAVAVVDDWQQRGVATELLRRLADRAREEGIARFVATALTENRAVRGLLSELGPAETHPAGAGFVEMRIDLPATAEPDTPLRRALRRAAEGRLAVRGALRRAGHLGG